MPQISRLVSLDKILLDRGFKKIRTYELMLCFKEDTPKPEVPIGFRSVTLNDIYNIEKFVELQNQSFSGSMHRTGVVVSRKALTCSVVNSS